MNIAECYVQDTIHVWPVYTSFVSQVCFLKVKKLKMLTFLCISNISVRDIDKYN